jgi:hypothetical protein
VKIHLSPSVECSDDFGDQISLNTVDETGGYLDFVQWDELGYLAEALMAPCARLRLDCCLEQSADGSAIVMRRLP